ncbi:MAG: hypothetical protein K6G94_12345, partial [Kiritimatiellae bacterium]|nr:hypothetical protein [Kiritimatiellia bacterium]
ADDRVVRAATADIKSCEGDVFCGSLKLDIWTALSGEYAVKTSSGPETKVVLKAGGNKVTVPCEYTKDGRIATDITLVDKAGRKTARSYPVFVEYRPIRVRLTTPQYRNNFYPGQDASRVSGSVAVPDGETAELVLEGPGFRTQTATIAARGEFSFDTAGFRHGDAWLTVKAGKDVEKVRIRNLPPTGHTMTWVENGNLIVDGRPTLRRNIYAQGYMTGKAFNERFEKEKDSFRLTPIENTLSAEPNRMINGLERREAILDVKPSAEYLDAIKKIYERHKDSDYSAWYICDEPECRSVSPIYLNHVYEHLKDIDPYHVVFMASRGGEAYINAADWFETHPYLNAMNDENGRRIYGIAPSAVGSFVDAFAPDRHPDKSIGFLPTCFAYRWTSWSSDYPTFDEYVLHTWAAMMRGGKTLWPYAGHDLGDRSALYNGTRYIFESFEALEELVLLGKRTTFLKENDMEGVLYELPGEKMFVVVNFAATNAVTRLSGVRGEFREFRAARRFGAKGAEVSPIEMKPLETIVATTKDHDEGLEPKAETVARIDREEAERLGRDNQLLERSPDITVNTNCKRNFGGGHYKLFDGTHEMVALHSKCETNAYVEISCNGFRVSFDKVRVWGWGLVDKLEVDIRKGGEWVPQKVESRRSEKYMHEVSLVEPVSVVKMRLRFPGAAGQPNDLEVYEIELPRLADGVSVQKLASQKVLRDEGMSLVWDGSDCACSEKWSDKAWMYGDVAEPGGNGGFTMKKSGTRYMAIRPDDKWLVFDVAAFHNIGEPRAYRAWFASLAKLCPVGMTVSHPQPGIYSFPLPKRDKPDKYPLRIDIHGMTVDFNAIKLGQKPVDRVEVGSSTEGVIAPGSIMSVRACLSGACEEVAAELLLTPKAGGMKPFAVNGTKGLELRMLDEEGFIWGADIPVSHCGNADGRSVLLKVTPLGNKGARPLFGSIEQKFAAAPEEVRPISLLKSGIVQTNERFVVSLSEKNGALASLVMKEDADHMNWIHGLENWGEVRTNIKCYGGTDSWTGAAFRDSEKLPFIGFREEDGRFVSVYDNGILRAEVGRELTCDSLKERYVFTNVSKSPLYFGRGDLGILATFNDDYAGADECIRRRCSAHIWCGGGNSWVRAVKMGPFPTELALVLNEGSLDWYSVRRVAAEGSNDRGDIVLHPDSFVLQPNESMTIAWALAAYGQGGFKEALLSHGGAAVEFEQETIFPDEKFRVTITEPSGNVRRETYAPEKGVGEYPFVFKLEDGRTARATGYCSPAFDDLVRARVRFIVERQQCLDEKSSLYGAFLPYDNEDGRQCFSAVWRDMNACRERTAMPIMIAKYLQRHGEDAAARRALDLWEVFALREFFDADTCAVYDGIGKDPRFKRLYNGPQLIGLWKEMYELKKDAKYLDWIERSVVNFYEGGGTNFYPNGCSFSEELVLLKRAGRDVSRIERYLCEHVANIARNGICPPAHEVKYEQTIVAPAVTILSAYSTLVERDGKVDAVLPSLVDALSCFNGNQPDHRLNEIAIRHWDGYWFGKRHAYGDTLHQHSALSARAYLWYTRAGGDATWCRRAEHTYRNVLAMFTPDGRATAAYVLPLTVTMVNRDGSLAEPTRRVQGPDPLANDQDSALYNAMASGLFGNYGQNVSSIHAFAALNRRVKQ